MIWATHIDFSPHTFPMLKTGCFTAHQAEAHAHTGSHADHPHSSKAHCMVCSLWSRVYHITRLTDCSGGHRRLSGSTWWQHYFSAFFSSESTQYISEVIWSHNSWSRSLISRSAVMTSRSPVTLLGDWGMPHRHRHRYRHRWILP